MTRDAEVVGAADGNRRQAVVAGERARLNRQKQILFPLRRRPAEIAESFRKSHGVSQALTGKTWPSDRAARSTSLLSRHTSL